MRRKHVVEVLVHTTYIQSRDCQSKKKKKHKQVEEDQRMHL